MPEAKKDPCETATQRRGTRMQDAGYRNHLKLLLVVLQLVVSRVNKFPPSKTRQLNIFTPFACVSAGYERVKFTLPKAARFSLLRRKIGYSVKRDERPMSDLIDYALFGDTLIKNGEVADPKKVLVGKVVRQPVTSIVQS